MGCITYPELPYIAPTPARLVYHNDFSWNAGANSVDQLDGDVVCAFSMGRVVGVVVGFTQDREGVEDFARMSHAFSFSQSEAGEMQVRVMEAGKIRSAPMTYNDTTAFELRRINGAVSYCMDGAAVYVSRVVSSGTLSVGTSLYATGDEAP